LQAQDDLNKQIEKLKIDSLTTQSSREQQQNGEIDRLKNLLNGKDDLIKNITNSKDEIIKNLQTEINKLNQIRTEYENIKHQVTHVDTFRNELIKSRQEIENIKSEYEQQLVDLKSQIEYLSLTPTKKKKPSVVKEQEEIAQLPLVEENNINKDGGTF
jgi:chromosome segregation ATPase